jgi:integrase
MAQADTPTSSRDVRFWGQSGHEPTLTTVQRRGDVPTVVWADRAGHMAKSHPQAGHANHLKRTVTPRRRRNGDLRTREYLTEHEVERLIAAAKHNRHGHRDATTILVAYRHGLRAAEVVDLRWDQVDFKTATLHVRRVKAGTPSTHPILGDELRALRRLQREQDKSPFVFTSERGAPFGTAGFARMVERAGVEAKLGFKVHPHMLRHACGYALANRGHDTRALQAYLGHKNIQHTVRYTELSSTRFKNFWRE